jgi:hypothetical protein
MQILAISESTTNATLEKIQPHLLEEVRDTMELYLRDVIRNYYFRSDKNGVVFMLECNSVDEAQSELENLKLVREGMIQFNLIPLEPLKPLGILLKNDR